jgi:hypothetical protein
MNAWIQTGRRPRENSQAQILHNAIHQDRQRIDIAVRADIGFSPA